MQNSPKDKQNNSALLFYFSHLTDSNMLPEGLGRKSLILLVTLKLKTKHYFISFCYKNVFLAHHLVVVMKKVGDKHFSS